ncbi:MAG: hypothetical protein AAGF23_17970, partial [Acidobacteriota bacterium]
MHRLTKLLSVTCAFVLAAFLASPSAAFLVILKDGEQITAAERYERQGDMVILTLPNGTKASYPAADIDFEKTDDVNRGRNLSNARLIEGREAKQLDKESRFEKSQKSFSELVNQRTAGGGLALPEQSRREAEGQSGEIESLPKTAAGFVDLKTIRRDPLDDEALATEITRYMRSQGAQDVRVYRGTGEGRPLVEVVATSEASVFKAVRDSANCLVQLRGKFSSLTAFDLLLLTENQILAGQFSLTPELANELVTGKIEPP